MHVLAAGALPSTQGSSIANLMMLKACYDHGYEGPYKGLVTEATGFASQRLVTKQRMEGLR
jgi:hypothetical protein